MNLTASERTLLDAAGYVIQPGQSATFNYSGSITGSFPSTSGFNLPSPNSYQVAVFGNQVLVSFVVKEGP